VLTLWQFSTALACVSCIGIKYYQCNSVHVRVVCHFIVKPQNHRMVGVGRDLCGSSSMFGLGTDSPGLQGESGTPFLPASSYTIYSLDYCVYSQGPNQVTMEVKELLPATCIGPRQRGLGGVTIQCLFYRQI